MQPERASAGGPIHVLWRSGELESSEHAVLHRTDVGWRLEGTTVLPIDGAPAHIEHEVVIDADWRTRAATIRVRGPVERRFDISVRHGAWAVDGRTRDDLAGCVDLDLGWTPATNLLPVRRLGLEVGGSATVENAWLRFPELELERNRQTYTRTGDTTWRYHAEPYDFEIVVDEVGFTTRYGDDLWIAVARST